MGEKEKAGRRLTVRKSCDKVAEGEDGDCVDHCGGKTREADGGELFGTQASEAERHDCNVEKRWIDPDDRADLGAVCVSGR